MADVAEALSVPVALGDRSYSITIGSGLLPKLAQQLAFWISRSSYHPGAPGRALVITDEHVLTPHAEVVLSGLQAAEWSCEQLVVPAGEQSKCLAVASEAYDWLVAMRADRHTVVVAVGGGVVGDAAGFVAATFARGLPFVQVPTTLLADVDSSVGGKVGINHPRGKNLIGAFHQPLGVLIDTDVLGTLPDRDYRSGLAEVVKYGVILDSGFFEFLEKNIAGLNRREADVLTQVIATSCRLKAQVVEQDEYERTGLRAVLNYGHTFAHAFEALCGYGELLHGEAVAIGMVYASHLAERRGLIGSADRERQEVLLAALSLPTNLPAETKLAPGPILEAMRLDKKTVGGQLRFVLPTKIGHVEVFKDVPEADVEAVLKSLLPS